MERILLLEDDKSLVTGLTLALGRAGYALDTARTLWPRPGICGRRAATTC